MLEKTLKSPLDIKEIKPVNLKGNQPWILFGRGFSGGSVVKHLPAMQESRVRLLVRKIPWRRIWQPTPVFLLRKSHGQRSLVGCIQSMGQQRVGYDLVTQQQFFGRTDAEAEALILWLPDTKSWLSGKDPDAGKDWRQEEETTEDEMVGWHHQLDGHEFEHTLGDGEGQGGLAGCGPWGCKESRYNWASELNWTDSQRVIKAKKNEPQTCLNSL